MKVKFNFEAMHWENIPVSQVKLWESLYPDIDVVDQITVQMVRWLDKVKDTKKARKRDWKKFIVNWLKREQQKAVLG